MTKYSKKGKGKEKVRKKTRKGKQIKGGAEIPVYEEPVPDYEVINYNHVGNP